MVVEMFTWWSIYPRRASRRMLTTMSRSARSTRSSTRSGCVSRFSASYQARGKWRCALRREKRRPAPAR
eukprot:1422098-Prymnesium_polylepis.1